MNKIKYNNLKIKSNSYEEGMFSGLASVYHEIDSHKDIILPRAFEESLNEPSRIKMLWQHDSTRPIGVFTKIEELPKGLYVEGKIITSTRKGREAFELIKEGAVDGLSLGFEIEEYSTDGALRYISKGKLWEISIVTFPANEQARIHALKSVCSADGLMGKLTTAIELMQKSINDNNQNRRGYDKRRTYEQFMSV